MTRLVASLLGSIFLLTASGCGQTEIGANTGCAKFIALSDDDQVRAIKAMQIDRRMGTSDAEVSAARSAARRHCAPGGIAGAVNDIYDTAESGDDTGGPDTTTTTGVGSGATDTAGRTYRVDFDASGLGGEDGSTAEGVLSVGEIQPLDDAIQAGYELHCYRSDTSRAAAIVGEASIENTTPRFSVMLALAIGTGSFVSYSQMGRTVGDVSTREFLDSRAGSACLSGTATFGLEDAGEGVRLGPIPFALIFDNYYSPNQPEGDPDRLRRTVITFGGLGWSPNCISGPGADAGVFIPADGESVEAKAEEVGYEAPEFGECS